MIKTSKYHRDQPERSRITRSTKQIMIVLIITQIIKLIFIIN